MAKKIDRVQRRELISQAAQRHWRRDERQGPARRASAATTWGSRSSAGGASSHLSRKRRPGAPGELRAPSSPLP